MSITRISMIVAVLCVCGGLFAQDATGDREAKLIAVLKSGTDARQKTDACLELGRVGTDKAVPALSALLADEKLSHAARHGLVQLQDPVADQALRSALVKVKGVPLLGVIDSVGIRRDAKAVETLTSLLKHADAAVVEATARALGSIGNEGAAKGLQAALATSQGAHQKAICEGLFRCAELLAAKGETVRAIAIYDSVRSLPKTAHQIRTAAWRGAVLLRKDEGLPLLMEAVRSSDRSLVVAAARIAREVEGPAVVKLLADELSKLPADRQVLLTGVLGQRRDPAALPALLGLAKSGEKTVRVSALNAAVEIGNTNTASVLIDLLDDPEPTVAKAAASGLAGVNGSGVDDTLIKALKSSEPALKSKLVAIAGQRRMAKAIPLLEPLLESSDKTVRLAAIKSYGEMAGMRELPGLLAKLEKSTQAGELDALTRVLTQICGAAKDPKACVPKLKDALGRSVPEAKPALLRLLNVAGGADALKAVRAAVGDNDKTVHTAAMRVLCEWKSVEAAPVLLELTKNAAEPVDRIRALRGYLGLAMRSTLPQETKLDICKKAAPMIQRQEEKRMLLAAVGNLADPKALGLIVPYLDDPRVKQDTIVAILAVAKKRPKKKYLGETKAALEKVVKTASSNPKLTKHAQSLLKQIAAEQ